MRPIESFAAEVEDIFITVVSGSSNNITDYAVLSALTQAYMADLCNATTCIEERLEDLDGTVAGSLKDEGCLAIFQMEISMTLKWRDVHRSLGEICPSFNQRLNYLYVFHVDSSLHKVSTVNSHVYFVEESYNELCRPHSNHLTHKSTYLVRGHHYTNKLVRRETNLKLKSFTSLGQKPHYLFQPKNTINETYCPEYLTCRPSCSSWI